MHIQRYLWGCLLILGFLTSCEKEIKVDLPGYSDKMVVEGYVENGQYPYVYLSKNRAFFDGFNFSIPQLGEDFTMDMLNDLIKEIYAMTDTNAVIIISDGVMKDTLKMVPLSTIMQQYMTGQGNMPPIYWTTTRMKGEAGKNYYLDVFTEDKHLTSQVSILNPLFHNDSIWFTLKPNSDTYGNIIVRIKDNPSQRDYYRYYAKRVNKDANFISCSLISDDFFNGKTFTYPLFRSSGGKEANVNDPDDEDGNRSYYRRGDTVILKTCKLDKATFDFWNTISYGTSGGFIEPEPIKSNVNGGLGIFGGYSAVYDTIVLK